MLLDVAKKTKTGTVTLRRTKAARAPSVRLKFPPCPKCSMCSGTSSVLMRPEQCRLPLLVAPLGVAWAGFGVSGGDCSVLGARPPPLG